MELLSTIAPDATVRQVATTWPACAQVLGEYAGARCNGRWTLQELSHFARSQGIGERQLLARLAAAAGVAQARSWRKQRSTATPIPIVFIALGVALTLGAGWGVLLLLRIAMGVDYGTVSGASVHVHGVAQLWGWMTLFIFAVATHLLRQNTTRPAPVWMERAATGMIVAALLLFFAGLSAWMRLRFPWIDIAGSAMLLGGSVLFGASVAWSLSGAAKSQRKHGFIFLLGWLWAWAGSDLWLRLHYPEAAMLPESARKLLIVLPVLGLGVNAIYGFGIRLIPGLLNIARLRHGVLGVALLLHNVGLCLFLIPHHIAAAAGALLMLAASVLYLAGTNFLVSKPSRPIHGIDPRGHILIRIAFFWLVFGLGMVVVQQFDPKLPHAYSGAWRHALTVGFITTMIMGVGYRIVPIFIKQPLASTRLMLVSAALIIVGNAGRVFLELATIRGPAWTFRLMGMTGVLELTALTLFAVDLALTVRKRWHVYGPSDRLTADVRVREAINTRPELLCRLDDAGITMFDEAPFIAPSMTLGALALASGWHVDELLERLESRS